MKFEKRLTAMMAALKKDEKSLFSGKEGPESCKPSFKAHDRAFQSARRGEKLKTEVPL
jgi:hypothetical protein